VISNTNIKIQKQGFSNSNFEVSDFKRLDAFDFFTACCCGEFLVVVGVDFQR
jgi:hypothetical protein